MRQGAGPHLAGLDADAPPLDGAARRSLTPAQTGVLVLAAAAVFGGMVQAPHLTMTIVAALLHLLFLLMAVWRVIVVIAGARPPPVSPAPPDLPIYTIVAALHDEAEVVPQLVRRLAALDYPSRRLQGFLVLEAHDTATIRAARQADRPDWLQMMVVPPGAPQTKPRALNHALRFATGDLLTVYDAEDHPHPNQLREAAARFHEDGAHGDGRLACLQAPLRIRPPAHDGRASPFLAKQFAVEYAAQFEVTTPGLVALGLPFPLGGTSNHFRVDVLRAVGGWDAHNVTEDADLGFRLWRCGWRAGVLNAPTWESAPATLHDWLPQRTRWLKGYMQTWGVHTRSLHGLGPRGLLALAATTGAAVVSAAVHAPAIGWMSVSLLLATLSLMSPLASALSVSVLVLGAATAWLAAAIGARRAGLPYGATDMLVAPAYWSLLSLAFVHALWRLIREPFAWDKTPHQPDNAPLRLPDAGRQAA